MQLLNYLVAEGRSLRSLGGGSPMAEAAKGPTQEAQASSDLRISIKYLFPLF